MTPESQCIENLYMQIRGVPPAQELQMGGKLHGCCTQMMVKSHSPHACLPSRCHHELASPHVHVSTDCTHAVRCRC